MTVLSLTSTFNVLWVHNLTYPSLVQQVQWYYLVFQSAFPTD